MEMQEIGFEKDTDGEMFPAIGRVTFVRDSVPVEGSDLDHTDPDGGYFRCRNCGSARIFMVREFRFKHCPMCGAKLDWKIGPEV